MGLVLLGCSSASACGSLLPGPPLEEHQVQTLREHLSELEQLESAAASTPSDLPRLADVDAELQICKPNKCDDDTWGNTSTIVDLDVQLTWARKMLEAASNGKERAKLESMKTSGTFERMEATRYFALQIAEDERSYDGGATGRWHGRVVVWDRTDHAWVGQASIELDGPDPTKLVTNVEIGSDGTQTITYIDDPSGDEKRAGRTLDATRRLAVRVALETGQDITRPEQVLRDPPQPVPTLPRSGVVVVGRKSGELGVLASDGVHALGLDEVVEVWAADGGFALRRSSNTLSDETPRLLHLADQQLHDVRFWTDWGPSRSKRIKVDYDGHLWAFDSTHEGPIRVGTWAGTRWRDLDVSTLPKERIADVAAAGSRAVLLSSNRQGGSWLHEHDGNHWSPTPIAVPGRPHAVTLSGPTTLVGTDAGLWQVTADSPPKRLHRSTAFHLTATDSGGAVVAFLEDRGQSFALARVNGDQVSKTGLRPRTSESYAIGSGGLVAAQKGGTVVELSAAGGPKTRCEVEGTIKSVDLDAQGRTWVGTETGLFTCVANEAVRVPLDGVEGLQHGVRAVKAYGDALDPATISGAG